MLFREVFSRSIDSASGTTVVFVNTNAMQTIGFHLSPPTGGEVVFEHSNNITVDIAVHGHEK